MSEELPAARRKHPELAKLLQLTASDTPAHQALMDFLRAFQPSRGRSLPRF